MKRLLGKLRSGKKQRTEAPSCAPGSRVYAIGDIHGRADLLQEMHAMILADAEGFEGRLQIVYLGDYVDRGDTSRQVVEMLLEDPLADFQVIYLKGNHEQALLDFIDYPEATAGWLVFGGRATLASYGVDVSALPHAADLTRLSGELDKALPALHRQFFNSGQRSWESGDYYFVHAGVRPGVALDRQHFEDQMWIREEFLDSDRDHGKVVVHGHTVFAEVQFRHNRISIDTGAFETGVLTALVLEGEGQRLLQTGPAAE